MTFKEGEIPDHVLRKMSPQDRPAGKAGKTQEELAVTRDAKNEKELQNQIHQYIRMRGVKFVVWQSMAKKSGLIPGTPDFLMCFHGYPLALEVKHGDGKRTPEQVDAFILLAHDGWVTREVRSIADVKAVMDWAEANKNIFG